MSATFILRTDAILDSGLIDPRYTCDLDNSSPELRWEGEPEGTESFAVVVEDPDAPGGLFTHWLVYGIPKDIHHLPAGIPAQDSLPNGIRQGLNSYGKLGYAGPCPPLGSAPHRYLFRLFALRGRPELSSRIERQALLDAMYGLVLAQTDILGRFRRLGLRAG